MQLLRLGYSEFLEGISKKMVGGDLLEGSFLPE